mmetsp:Transcript_27636/g.38866  ORF Transcript_27636/g.38866 Transcript_27636/m.38866 type:complete len:86 (-) Transcript_27636:246-503(-)
MMQFLSYGWQCNSILAMMFFLCLNGLVLLKINYCCVGSMKGISNFCREHGLLAFCLSTKSEKDGKWSVRILLLGSVRELHSCWSR